MASTGLHGPHALTHDEINRVVASVGIGCYALGPINDENLFVVRRVGRSDTGLNGRLHKYVDEYPYFKYGFFETVRQCYEHECRIWHEFKPKNNPNHPDRPTGTDYPCPIPDCPH